MDPMTNPIEDQPRPAAPYEGHWGYAPPPLKVIGSGPFPIPGEQQRWIRADYEARRDLAMAEGQPVPPPPVQPWKAKSRKEWWTKGPGIVLLLVGAGLLIGLLSVVLGAVNPATPARQQLQVEITSCEFDGADIGLPSATVGLQITNTGSTAKGARVEIEYRDGGGARVDTDTAYVKSIAPGDVARHEETTLLDAGVTSGGSCHVVGVR
jgi:hypothetical protein